MTPKFILLTRKSHNPLIDADVWVNPRRVNKFHEAPRYTATPNRSEGTVVDFGRDEKILVCETCEQIRKLLSK